MKALTTPSLIAQDDAIAAATLLLAEARGRCVALGVTPQKLAELFLPEALLALMVSDMRQEEVEHVFANFARDEIPAWFLQVKRTAGYCDCEREVRGLFVELLASPLAIDDFPDRRIVYAPRAGRAAMV